MIRTCRLSASTRLIPTRRHVHNAKTPINEKVQIVFKAIIHNESSHSTTTPLHEWAASKRKEPSPELTRFFLSLVQNVDKRDYFGLTPLSNACRVGLVDVARQLLEKGADTSGNNPRGASPLHHLMLSKNFDPSFAIGEALLKHGAKVNAKDYDKRHQSPLLSLIESDENADENLLPKVEWLLKNGANVIDEGKKEPRDSFDYSRDILQICFDKLDPYPNDRSLDRYYRPLLPLLAQYHPGKSTKERSNWSLLHWAAYKQCTKAAEILMKKGFTFKQEAEITPYKLALFHQNHELIRLFNHNPTEIDNLPSSFWGTMAESIFKTHAFNRYSISGLPNIPNFGNGIYKNPKNGSPMQEALDQQNLSDLKSLLSNGWNRHLENDFHTKPFEERLFKKCTPPHKWFYASAFKAFNDCPHSSLSLSTAASLVLQHLGVHTTEFHLNILFDAGLTPELFKKQTSMDFLETIDTHYYRSFDSDRGEFVTYKSHEPLCAIRCLIQKRGWAKY